MLERLQDYLFEKTYRLRVWYNLTKARQYKAAEYVSVKEDDIPALHRRIVTNKRIMTYHRYKYPKCVNCKEGINHISWKRN